MIMKKLLDKKYFYMLIAIFLFILFWYISYKMPITGDDWGYYLAGENGGALKTAIEFYTTWSGRFFSEIWDTFFSYHKNIWNIVNPLLFTISFICVFKLSGVKNKIISSCLLILVVMLTVPNAMRMESYTWVTGSIYSSTLTFSLIYFTITEKLFLDNEYDKKTKILSYLSNILLFIIGLMVENIAATMIVGIVVLIIYAYFNKKSALKYLIINLFFSIISFVIMRVSPGSASRATEHAAWQSASIFEKIVGAYPNFLEMSFINNKYAISFFSIVLILLIIFTKKEIKNIYKVIFIIINLFGIFTVFSYLVVDGVFNNPESLYSYIYWPIYVISAFITIFMCMDNEYTRNKALFTLMIGGCSVLVLLYSPIYGSRHAIYLVYYLIITMVIIYNDININNNIISICLLVICSLLSIQRAYSWVNLYREVGVHQIEREQIIQYYVENPDIEEVWLPRFPAESIHGADIEIGDTYHFETLKEYYKLPQDADKIIFYWEDSE